MQKEEENEKSAMDSLFCPSFSIYSSNNLNDVVEQVINENDHSYSLNDNDDFEFVAFQKTTDEAFFDHRPCNTTHGVFSISKRDDGAESLILLQKSMNREAAEISNIFKEENESLTCLSFSVYSSNNLNDIAERVIHENDHSYFKDDNDDFEFVAFQNTADEVFQDHRSRNTTDGVFLISNRDDEKRNSDSTEILIPLQKLTSGDEKQNIESPLASRIKCNKSSSTGSSSNSSYSKRWKFLSLLRRSKSDVEESFILTAPVEDSKVKSNGKGNVEKSLPIFAENKIPVTKRKILARVTAMEAFYMRKKEIKRKSFLPYKQELRPVCFGFFFK